MLVTVPGMVIDAKEVHASNAYIPILVIPLGMVIEVMDVQSVNA